MNILPILKKRSLMRLASNRALLKGVVAAGLLAARSLPLAAAEFPAVSSVYVHYAADNPANTTLPPLRQAFTVGDVDLANQKLALPNLGFSPIVYPGGIGPATPVYFSSTGKLPAPLQPATPYYVVPAAGGGYKVFAAAVDADAPFQPGGVLGEKVLPAQNVSQGVRSIVFTDAGTGMHTLATKTLISQLTDLTANGYNSSAVNASDKHALLEVDADSGGRKFIRTAGATARENFVGSYSAYGQVFLQSPGAKRFEARQRVGGKRVVYQIFVGRVRSFKERQVVKFLADPALVDPGTDRVKYAADHRMRGRLATGDLLNGKADAGSALPAPLVEGTDYYVRRSDNSFVTLHPTAADAASNTNVINLTSAGTGSFLFWAPERVGDARRWSFFAEVLEPGKGGGNTLSVRLSEPVPSSAGVLKIGKAFTVAGSGNGNISGFGNLPELSPVVLWTPPRAVLPAPLRAGVTYWTTRNPASPGTGRLHATLASAKEGAGKATSDSGCIKFTAPGSGEMLTSYADGASAITFGTLGPMEPMTTRVPLGPLCVLVFKIDFADPAQPSVLATLGVNEAVTEQKLLKKIPKGLTPAAADDHSHAWTLFNSAQGHVPIDLDLYELVFGSSADAVPDSEIQALVGYFKTKYRIETETSDSITNKQIQ
jgi:hypothetical protein